MTQPPGQYPPGSPDPNLPPQQPGYNPPPQPGYPPPGQPPGYPPQGGYPPPGGYPPGGGGYPPPQAPPPPGYNNTDEKTWALVSHFGGAAGSLISGGVLACVAPLIAYLAKGKESPTIKAHSTAALNFFLPISGAALIILVVRTCFGVLDIGIVGSLISILLGLAVLALWVAGAACGIIAGVKANNGELWKYPLPFKFIK